MKNDYYLINLHKNDAQSIINEINNDIYEEYNSHSGNIELEWFEGYQAGFKDVLRLLNVKPSDLEDFIANEDLELNDEK